MLFRILVQMIALSLLLFHWGHLDTTPFEQQTLNTSIPYELPH
jgi:hypothetical protein